MAFIEGLFATTWRILSVANAANMFKRRFTRLTLNDSHSHNPTSGFFAQRTSFASLNLLQHLSATDEHVLTTTF
ncbi:hypothetical protein IE81DRAFT_325217 [Ceraceosorus guamensis]|uniref:Uncharacterized protein n=1 Tax=Ceraceosorus guamensis TaxID=1522189 RepID=A0A316VX20_9BASI|nr:hypothetical protein IE81DRAFT_325217 [Ceraceosorus guamensis]PWN40831.1 hypothetical protein IE81DRAFT_325217 [Ceraceosorus guamensis]